MSDATVIVFAGTLETRFEGDWIVKVMRNGMLQLENRRQRFVFKNWDYYKLVKATGAVI